MTRPQFDALLITCEHASNAVPEELLAAFYEQPEVLDTHRAWDPGAAVLARELAERFGVSLFEGGFTRLLIDLNRKADSPKAFSEFTPRNIERELKSWHEQWRKDVLYRADELITGGALLHLSIHSFTPELDGKLRDADIGLLFDPARPLEKAAAAHIKQELAQHLPDSRVRNNYPYAGTSDGMTTWLRERMGRERYAGLEIELNQAFSAKPADEWRDVRGAIADAVAGIVMIF